MPRHKFDWYITHPQAWDHIRLYVLLPVTFILFGAGFAAAIIVGTSGEREHIRYEWAEVLGTSSIANDTSGLTVYVSVKTSDGMNLQSSTKRGAIYGAITDIACIRLFTVDGKIRASLVVPQRCPDR